MKSEMINQIERCDNRGCRQGKTNLKTASYGDFMAIVS